MTAATKVLSYVSGTTSPDAETFKMLVLLCGVGLVGSLLLVIAGLDLGIEVFF